MENYSLIISCTFSIIIVVEQQNIIFQSMMFKLWISIALSKLIPILIPILINFEAFVPSYTDLIKYCCSIDIFCLL